MTFANFSKKLLISNMRSYPFCIYGNVAAISLFLAFATIYTNTSFMNATVVNAKISSNILFASDLIAVFFIVMVLISGRIFWRMRQKEYAVMTVLGMRQKEAVYYIIRENLLTAIVTMGIALPLGTMLSLFFYLVIRYGIGIEGIIWLDNGKGYWLTALGYGLATVISIVLNAIRYEKENLISKLNGGSGEKDGVIVKMIKRYAPQKWNRYLPKIAFIRLHKWLWRIRYGLGILLCCGMIFLIGICVSAMPGFRDDAERYSPFDLLYTESRGVNQVSHEEINQILQDNGVEVTEYRQFDCVRNAAFNFISVTEVNSIFDCRYEVNQGECIQLFQIDQTDGYEHDMTPIRQMDFTDDFSLTSIGSDIRILWNPGPAFADRTLIVSAEDYNRIKCLDDCCYSVTHLYQFRDWTTSKEAVERIDEYLQEKNGFTKEEQYYYRTSSRIEQYQIGKQSGSFLLFVMSFVVFVLGMAMLFISYFGLLAEQEEHRKIVENLRGIGVTKEQMQDCLVFRNRARYMFPVVIGEILGMILVLWWNWKACQMRISVLAGDILIAGLLMLSVWIVAGRLTVNDTGRRLVTLKNLHKIFPLSHSGKVFHI